MGDAENYAAMIAQQQQQQATPANANTRADPSALQNALNFLKANNNISKHLVFRRRAAEDLRVSLQTNPRLAVIAAYKHDVIEVFCKILKKTNDDNLILEQILWSITNLSHANSPIIHEMIPKGIVKLITLHVRSSSAQPVRDQAIMCIGNIATDCQMCREYVIEAEVLETLLDLMKTPMTLTMSQRDTYAWTIQNIIRPATSDEEAKLSGQNRGKLMHTIYQLITLPAPDDSILQGIEILHDWVMADSEKIVGVAVVSNEPLMKRLLQIFQNDKDEVASKVIRTIGNLAFNDDDVIQDIIDYGFVDAMHARLISAGIVLEADMIWCISNILGSLRPTCIHAIYDREELLEFLVINCYNAECKIRREAIFCAINIITYFKDETKEQLYRAFFGKLIIDTLIGYTIEDGSNVSMCQAVQGILTHCCEEMKAGTFLFNDMIQKYGLEDAIRKRVKWVEENLPKHETGTPGNRELQKLHVLCFETLRIIDDFKQISTRPFGFASSSFAPPPIYPRTAAARKNFSTSGLQQIMKNFPQ